MRFTNSLRKKAKLFANSGEPDQTPHSAASDLRHEVSFASVQSDESLLLTT